MDPFNSNHIRVQRKHVDCYDPSRYGTALTKREKESRGRPVLPCSFVSLSPVMKLTVDLQNNIVVSSGRSSWGKQILEHTHAQYVEQKNSFICF